MHHPLKLIVPILVILVAGLALWYVLTRPAPSLPAPEAPSGQTAAVEEIAEQGAYHEIDAQYPGRTALTGAADAAAVASMRAFLEDDIASFKQNSGLSSLTPEDIAMWGLGSDRKFAYGATYATYTSPHTVSYLFDIYVDSLGAHPNGYHRSFTFDLRTGAELSVGDLFVPGAPYLTILSDIARRDLPSYMATKGGLSVSDIDTEYIASGTEPNDQNFSAFYLDGGDLVLVFQPYQVAPWVFGTQELRIPRSELSGSLKADYE